ncbi:MAG: PaaI family thioesterase [Candidatus Obscuribacter sp.]|jgi:uncharacterized protein (TIGR00369 family)|nr:PaaI family thioesterase [Candidatus Obscuribacter sp.]MBK9620014.1 PaaI family thioesterase [Candidatus Obscuribacter sp.]MBL0188132.1 PaaI family thioesterase [Candidatus Obscuribacter sp.]MDQ5967338.1 1,4-dihydroxy-2-naphthoyl-CoA hydrolase [Cyanobacteriota bacterium erpe_2018_sw_39hr_WHONDRS-SW48-000098_B_bin.30]
MKKYVWNALTALGGSAIDVKDGYALFELPLTEQCMNPTGVYHAGIIVTLADEAASAAAYGGPVSLDDIEVDAASGVGKKFPYSVQLSVNLLTNDPVGPIKAESKVVKRGRLTVVDTEVFSSKGELMCLMRSSHMMVDASKVGPHLKNKAAP